MTVWVESPKVTTIYSDPNNLITWQEAYDSGYTWQDIFDSGAVWDPARKYFAARWIPVEVVDTVWS